MLQINNLKESDDNRVEVAYSNFDIQASVWKLSVLLHN